MAFRGEVKNVIQARSRELSSAAAVVLASAAIFGCGEDSDKEYAQKLWSVDVACEEGTHAFVSRVLKGSEVTGTSYSIDLQVDIGCTEGSNNERPLSMVYTGTPVEQQLPESEQVTIQVPSTEDSFMKINFDEGEHDLTFNGVSGTPEIKVTQN